MHGEKRMQHTMTQGLVAYKKSNQFFLEFLQRRMAHRKGKARQTENRKLVLTLINSGLMHFLTFPSPFEGRISTCSFYATSSTEPISILKQYNKEPRKNLWTPDVALAQLSRIHADNNNNNNYVPNSNNGALHIRI